MSSMATLTLDQGTGLPGGRVDFILFEGTGVLMIRVDGEDRIALTPVEVVRLATWLPGVVLR